MENLNLIMNSLYNSRRSLSLRSISSRQQGTEIYDKSCRSLTRAAAAIKSRRASGSAPRFSSATVRSLRFFLLSLPLSLLVPPAHPPVPTGLVQCRHNVKTGSFKALLRPASACTVGIRRRKSFIETTSDFKIFRYLRNIQ